MHFSNGPVTSFNFQLIIAFSNDSISEEQSPLQLEFLLLSKLLPVSKASFIEFSWLKSSHKLSISMAKISFSRPSIVDHQQGIKETLPSL